MTGSFRLERLAGWGVTAASGFLAGATYAGIKGEHAAFKLDLGLLYSEVPADSAGMFTTSRIPGQPVKVSRARVGRPVRAVIVNSGCANVATGEEGLHNALEMTQLAAAKLGIDPMEVLVASTGVIGTQLPMDRIRAAVPAIVLSREGGADFARAITTTDSRTKEIAFEVWTGAGSFRIGGAAKGAGMIHPNMATMLAFITTDAAVAPGFLQACLRDAVEATFNQIDIDGDMSTSDTVFLLANGTSGTGPVDAGSPAAEAFRTALNEVCLHLAREIARDGEGAQHLIQVTVGGARSLAEARRAARAVASSVSLKAAVYGRDPNWGRVVAALGASGVDLDESRLTIRLGEVTLFREGRPVPFDREAARRYLESPEIEFAISLNLGPYQASAWASDLTEEYVRLNSVYTT